MPRQWGVLVAGLALVAIVSTSVSASPTLIKPSTVRVTNEEVSRETVDLGDPGRSAGDLVVVTQLLFNRRITPHAIGHEELTCTYLGRGGVLGGGTWSCQLTIYLRTGRIVALGNVHNFLLYSLPVVGGVGLYDNVGGSVTVTYLGANPRRQLLLFRLTI